MHNRGAERPDEYPNSLQQVWFAGLSAHNMTNANLDGWVVTSNGRRRSQRSARTALAGHTRSQSKSPELVRLKILPLNSK